MKKLCGFACLFTVLLGGALVAPLPAEAGNPTLTIDGHAVTLAQGGTGCGGDTGFKNGGNSVLNSCYSVTGANVTTDTNRTATLRVGNWYIGSVSASNHARVLVNDTATGTDNMKLTGITFTSATNTSITTPTLTSSTVNGKCALCQEGHAVISNSFTNAPNGAGDYKWQASEGGQFQPPTRTCPSPTCTPAIIPENAVNNRFRIVPTASGGGLTVTSFPQLDTGVWSTPTTPGPAYYITKGNPYTSALKIGTCTSSCQPTITYDYDIWVQGQDQLLLTDSVGGCGGTCQDPPCVPDEVGGGCEGQSTLACTSEFAPEGQPNLDALCGDFVTAAINQDVTDATSVGALLTQTCFDTCIIITMNATPAPYSAGGTFTFTATGPDMSTFTITGSTSVLAKGVGGYTFSNVTPVTSPSTGTNRDFAFQSAVPATDPKGNPWQTDQILCNSNLNNSTGANVTTWRVNTGPKNSNAKLSLTVLTIGVGDILTCNFHEH